MNTANPLQQFVEEVVAREASDNTQLDYWCELFPNLAYSPQQFYEIVARNLEVQQLPELEGSHVMIRQGGIFSSQRLYLQLRRERTVFEICGAPFGTGFFISSRLFDRRREPRFRDYVVLVIVLVCTVVVLSSLGLAVSLRWGWIWGVIAGSGVIAVIWTALRLAAAETFAWLDRILSHLPFVGAIYDHVFHPNTYYRHDTNNAYCQAVTSAVRRAIEEITGQKGLRPLTTEERRPMIADLHQ